MIDLKAEDKVEVLTGPTTGRGRVVWVNATVINDDGSQHAVAQTGWAIIQLDGPDQSVFGVEINETNLQKLGDA